MKIKLLAAFIFVLSSAKINAQYSYVQYFDGANTNPSNSIIINRDTASSNIWQIGKPQKTIFHSASTAPKALLTDTINFYPTNNISVFTISFHSPFSHMITALQWMQKIDMDPHKHDGGIVEFSADSGATWQNAFSSPNVANFYGYQSANRDTTFTGEKAFSGRDTTWRNVWLCVLPNTFPNPNQKAMFRFTFKSDSINNNREGWMIDNMMLHSTAIHPVNEMKKAENLKVFPTITNGIINIESPLAKENVPAQTIEFMSVDGKILERYSNANPKFSIDISRYEAGMYFLKISSAIRTENHPVQLIKN